MAAVKRGAPYFPYSLVRLPRAGRPKKALVKKPLVRKLPCKLVVHPLRIDQKPSQQWQKLTKADDAWFCCICPLLNYTLEKWPLVQNANGIQSTRIPHLGRYRHPRPWTQKERSDSACSIPTTNLFDFERMTNEKKRGTRRKLPPKVPLEYRKGRSTLSKAAVPMFFLS